MYLYDSVTSPSSLPLPRPPLRSPSPPSPNSGNPNIKSFTFLAFNDVYELNPVSGRGGLARVAALKKNLASKLPADGLVFMLAGDFLSPSAVGTAKVQVDPAKGKERLDGRQMVDVFNLMGVEAVAFGNHEFDNSEESLRARLTEAKFPFLAVNVRAANASNPFPNTMDAMLIERQGIKIGILSVTVNVPHKDYVVIDPYEESVEKMRNVLKTWKAENKEWDVLIALTHMSLDEDSRLAQLMPEIDIIMGGHEHQNWLIDRGNDIHPLPIAKADANAKTVFVHKFNLDTSIAHKQGVNRFGSAYNGGRGALVIESALHQLDETSPVDAETQKRCDYWVQLAFEAFKDQGINATAPMGRLTHAIDVTEAVVRSTNSEMGRIIADAMANEMKEFTTDVIPTLLNSGSIRIDDFLLPGEVTQYDAVRIVPFGGKTGTVNVIGKALHDNLKAAYAKVNSGTFPNYNSLIARKSDGTWTINGAPIDDQVRYLVNANDYMIYQTKEFFGTIGVDVR